MGGDALLANVSLQKRDNNDDFAIEDPSNYVYLDTGLNHQTNSRKVKKFYGNGTILQRKKYYNGGNIVYYLNNPWDSYQSVIYFLFISHNINFINLDKFLIKFNEMLVVCYLF